MSVAAIVQRRRQNLLTTFVRSTPPLVEVEDAQGLGRLLMLDEFHEGAATGALGRRGLGNVVMVAAAPGQPDSATLWVRASYGDYRSAYAAFLRENYQISVSASDLAAYDVDHLLNRARAGTGNALLRIEALPLSNNRQWGSFLEKLASTAQVQGNTRTRRLMSYLIAGKVAGFAPPISLDDRPSRLRLAQEIANLGLPLREVQEGLDNMLSHIARNLP